MAVATVLDEQHLVAAATGHGRLGIKPARAGRIARTALLELTADFPRGLLRILSPGCAGDEGEADREDGNGFHGDSFQETKCAPVSRNFNNLQKPPSVRTGKRAGESRQSHECRNSSFV